MENWRIRIGRPVSKAMPNAVFLFVNRTTSPREGVDTPDSVIDQRSVDPRSPSINSQLEPHRIATSCLLVIQLITFLFTSLRRSHTGITFSSLTCLTGSYDPRRMAPRLSESSSSRCPVITAREGYRGKHLRCSSITHLILASFVQNSL